MEVFWGYQVSHRERAGRAVKRRQKEADWDLGVVSRPSESQAGLDVGSEEVPLMGVR